MEDKKNKHWKRGFIQGCFDLFHIGHLNLIKRAKGRCDYLIAAVLEDELVARKGKWPAVPLAERLEIVKAIKYVDEVDIMDARLLSSKIIAWEKYHFDVAFSGDDHEHDGWGAEEEELKKRGADIFFFPYTKEVSSTTLHNAILPPRASDADKPREIGEFAQLFPFDKVNKGERVVVFGMDSIGEQFARQLKASEFCEVVAYTDSCVEYNGVFNGFQSAPVKDIVKNLDAFDRIVIASEDSHDKTVEWLSTMTIDRGKIV